MVFLKRDKRVIYFKTDFYTECKQLQIWFEQEEWIMLTAGRVFTTDHRVVFTNLWQGTALHNIINYAQNLK